MKLNSLSYCRVFPQLSSFTRKLASLPYRDFTQSCHERLFSDGQTREFRFPKVRSLSVLQQELSVIHTELNGLRKFWLAVFSPICFSGNCRHGFQDLGQAFSDLKLALLPSAWDWQKIVNISISCLKVSVSVFPLSPMPLSVRQFSESKKCRNISLSSLGGGHLFRLRIILKVFDVLIITAILDIF